MQVEGASQVDIQHFEKILPKLVTCLMFKEEKTGLTITVAFLFIAA